MATLSFISISKLTDLLQLAATQGGAYVSVLPDNRLGVGADPMSPTVALDFAKEALLPLRDAVIKPDVGSSERERPRVTRRSGNYWYEIAGKREEFTSLRELLGHALRALEGKHPGTLEKLCHIKPSSKRIVARERHKLFDAEHLCEEFGERLMTGWWYGTNNSSQETNRWLQRAAECAGLRWGTEILTNLAPA